jgi:protein transport protein SEC23
MDFQQRELQDGLRFSWNYWPKTKIGATRAVLPIGALYTPLKDIEGMQPVEYAPIQCTKCKSVLNPHCTIDFKFKKWSCAICQTPNTFPAHYANNISETQLPFELMRDYTTMEYVMPESKANQGNLRPIFLLLVDTAVPSEELSELKDSLQQSINFIPEDAMIGLITFGRMAYVHELGFPECPKCFVFRGDREMNSQQIQESLGLR